MSARNLKGDVMDYKILLSIIPVGKEKCITQKQLAAKLQCSTSAAKLLVKIAREHHIAILSGTDGYWISTSNNIVIFCLGRTVQKEGVYYGIIWKCRR